MTVKSNFNQIFSTVVVTIGIFCLGTVLGWSSPALPNMVKENHEHFLNISSEEQSWVGSTATLGALSACPIAGISIERYGRRRTMIFYAIPFTLGWILIGFSSNIFMMLLGRFISGFCGGIFSLSVPVYIGETVESHIRGMLMNAFQLMLVTGILFTYVVGAYVSWKALALICSCAPLVFLSFVPFIPESPRYLLGEEKFVEAQESLCWFRGTDMVTSVQTELSIVQNSVEESKAQPTHLKDIMRPDVMKPLAISLLLMILEQASAFNVVIFYCVDIFSSAGTTLESHMASIIVGIVQVVATVISTFFVDKAGRRPLLIFSEALMGISFIALGIFFFLKNSHDGKSPIGLGWLPLLSVTLFIVAFSVGIGPLSWTIMGEILHPNVKGLCSAIATSLVWSSAFIMTKIYPSLVEAVGIHWSFWIFSSVSIFGTVFVYIFVPETKNKSLEEIQCIFAKTPKIILPPSTTDYVASHI